MGIESSFIYRIPVYVFVISFPCEDTISIVTGRDTYLIFIRNAGTQFPSESAAQIIIPVFKAVVIALCGAQNDGVKMGGRVEIPIRKTFAFMYQSYTSGCRSTELVRYFIRYVRNCVRVIKIVMLLHSDAEKIL